MLYYTCIIIGNRIIFINSRIRFDILMCRYISKMKYYTYYRVTIIYYIIRRTRAYHIWNGEWMSERQRTDGRTENENKNKRYGVGRVSIIVLYLYPVQYTYLSIIYLQLDVENCLTVIGNLFRYLSGRGEKNHICTIRSARGFWR